MLLSPRYIPRLTATIGLFTRYGLKDFAKQQGLIELLPEGAAGGADGVNGDEGMTERAGAFRRRLVELGPAFVKLGQVLSTRPDLIPEPYIHELERLQDDVGAIPFEDVERTIEEEFGARISKLFASFDEEPVGTASLGQVHAAELRDGRAVVVKVQRPGIRETLADDIEFFREMARFLDRHTPAGERIDLVGVIQQLERALADELDYRVEARNAATFRLALAEFPHLLVPRVIEAYTSTRVLTTERVRGVKVDEINPLTRVEQDLSPLAEEFAKAYLKQITINGHFHADPHPGNVFLVLPGRENPRTPSEVVATDRRAMRRPALTPLSRAELEAQQEASADPALDEPRLALIDFGMTARLSNTLREAIVRLLLDISENHGDSAAEVLVEIGDHTEDFDRGNYVREIAQLIARNHSRAIGEMEAGTVLYEMINIGYQHGLKLPAELTLLAKALFSLDAVTRSLDPTYTPMNSIRDYANEIMNKRAREELSPRRLFQLATQTSELMRNLPHRLDILTGRLAANDFALHIESPQVSTLVAAMQKIANRIFSGLVLTGLLIASAMLLPYRRQLGTWGFVISAVIGIYMVVSILITDRRQRRTRT